MTTCPTVVTVVGEALLVIASFGDWVTWTVVLAVSVTLWFFTSSALTDAVFATLPRSRSACVTE